jgi:hypothetical protein
MSVTKKETNAMKKKKEFEKTEYAFQVLPPLETEPETDEASA